MAQNIAVLRFAVRHALQQVHYYSHIHILYTETQRHLMHMMHHRRQHTKHIVINYNHGRRRRRSRRHNWHTHTATGSDRTELAKVKT